MRISDWSSDVCSSDLLERLHSGPHPQRERTPQGRPWNHEPRRGRENYSRPPQRYAGKERAGHIAPPAGLAVEPNYPRCRSRVAGTRSAKTRNPHPFSIISARKLRKLEIGRASCRERVCQDGWLSLVDVYYKKKRQNN